MGLCLEKRMDSMQHQLLKQPLILNQLIVACGLGLFLGIASIWLPPYLLFIGIAGIVYVLVAWLWPEIALLGILVLTSTVFDIDKLPSISIGIGHILIPDILLFVLIGILFLRGMVESTSFFIHTPLDIPLLAFYGTAILSTAIAIFNSSITFNQSLGEVRIVNFFLTFFIVTNLVRSEKQVHKLFDGIIILAILVALAMIAQYALGPAVPILPGRVETLNTAGATSAGVARILPPGQSLVMLGFVCLVVQMLFDKTSSRFMRYLIQLGIIGLAVLLTFNRSFWAAVGLALFLVGLLVSIRDKVKYVKIVFWTVLIGAFVLTPFLVKGGQVEKLVSGAMTRMSSLFNPDTANEGSLEFRYIENKYAYPQIASHPLIGLGLGAKYRPWDPRLDDRPLNYGPNVSILDDYIHNGHLWVMLKTGLIGYLFFMWFLIMFSKRAIQNWRRIPDPFLKAIVLSFAVTIVGILVAALVNPIFEQSFWAPVIGIMLGMSEVILRMNHNQPLDLQKLGKSNLT
jgi:hypothetical protein